MDYPRIKVTIEVIDPPSEESRSYEKATKIFEQTLMLQWMQDNNPYMIQKIIAEVNTIKVKNDS